MKPAEGLTNLKYSTDTNIRWLTANLFKLGDDECKCVRSYMLQRKPPRGKKLRG